jgi:hypothetical protein
VNQRLALLVENAPIAHEVAPIEDLSRLSGRTSIFTGRKLHVLVDKNVKNALTHFAGVKMILFPFLKLQLAGHQLEKP